jgi:1-acyl-sn-glycerol-3-phosphate acyltransferase
LGITRTLIHVLLGTLMIAFCFPWASSMRRDALIRWWSRRVLRICGVTVRIAGSTAARRAAEQGAMLLLNHISWLDIYVVHVLKPARFVAKSEIRSWPMIGYLCDRTGTIFIERGKRHAVHQANQIVADALRKGDLVGVFPEGTTSDGTRLLPFHANLIQAAVDADVTVLPAALRYLKKEASGQESQTQDAAYVGEMSLFDSFKMVLRGAPILAELSLLEPLSSTGRSRHQLAEAARTAIAALLEINIDTKNDFSPAVALADTAPETTPGLPGELL